MLLNPFKFHSPLTLKEAASLYASLSHARLLAGGTFLINQLKILKRKGLQGPENVISLRKIPGMKGIAKNSTGLTIGSMTTFSEILDSSLPQEFEILKIVSRGIGTTPIRNMGTLGGNLASRYPWAEMGAVMIALNGQLSFVNSKGKEEALPAQSFFEQGAKSPGILSSIAIPQRPGTASGYYRVRRSADLDLPLLTVCIATRFIKNHFTETRAVVNDGSRFPLREKGLEAFLDQSLKNEKIIPDALKNMDLTVLETRASEYQRHMLRVGVITVLEDLIGIRHDNPDHQ